MPTLKCPTTGKPFDASAAAPGSVVSCPHCAGKHRVPDRPAAALRPTVIAAEPTICPLCKAPLAATTGRACVCPACGASLHCLYAASGGSAPAKPTLVCTFHPGVAAVGRCRKCRRAVCDVCVFSAGLDKYCGDCASTPDEGRIRSATGRGIASIVFSALAFLVFGLLFVLGAAAEDQKSLEAMSSCVVFLSLGLSITGTAMGASSKDKARGGGVLGLIGMILGIIAISAVILLMIAGMFMGG